MSKLTKQTERQTVHLVKNGRTTYPKTDEDYNILRNLKIPLSSIDEDFAPLLERVRKLHNLVFVFHDFTTLEHEMFAKVEAKWPFEIQLTTSELVLKAPKNVKQTRLDNLEQALRRWYLRHHITLEVYSKKSAKSLKVTLRKNQPT